MLRLLFLLIAVSLSASYAYGRAPVVVDSVSRQLLPNVTVYDCHGKRLGVGGIDGRLPEVTKKDYPLTIHFFGYKDTPVEDCGVDTVFLSPAPIELSELLVNTRRKNVLHILAYVREYSMLTSYSDTVRLFREKMVDYMLPDDRRMKYAGWRLPRILASKSYYRFTNSLGLDSVSDRCSHHFSWADWIGIPAEARMPAGYFGSARTADTIWGRYSPAEVWTRRDDRIVADVNVIADTTSRKWVPNLSSFFRNYIDFDRFRIRYEYDNILSDSIAPTDLEAYSFEIESTGRGHRMFMFNRVNEPFSVATTASVYILGREYISLKEARKWERIKLGEDDIAIYEPEEAPELTPEVREMVDRVNALDHVQVRLNFTPDPRLGRRHVVKLNVGQMILQRVKGMFGIDNVNAKRKWNRRWRDFRNERRQKNAPPKE